jgi:hypothetical protein
MKISHPVRALGRSVVRAMPGPLADAMRGAKRAFVNRRGAANVFRDIYVGNAWDGTESVSGPGSTMAATANIRAALPGLIDELGINVLLDVPCGDAFWIGQCLPPGLRYIGGDVVPEIVAHNKKTRPEMGTFDVLDLVNDPLPKADLILVRDCFIHLPNKMVRQALENIKRADARFLLTTTFPHESGNSDIELGGYRPVNLMASPFELGKPERILLDEDGTRRNGKHLGLWKLH